MRISTPRTDEDCFDVRDSLLVDGKRDFHAVSALRLRECDIGKMLWRTRERDRRSARLGDAFYLLGAIRRGCTVKEVEVVRLGGVVDESLELLEGTGDRYVEGGYSLGWFAICGSPAYYGGDEVQEDGTWT